MSNWWKSTEEAISSLQHATTQLQNTSARHAATLAGLLQTTASTKAAVTTIQSSVHDILLQLARLHNNLITPDLSGTLFSPCSPSFSSTPLHNTFTAPILLANPTSPLIHPHIPKENTQTPTKNTQTSLPQISTASPYFPPICNDVPTCSLSKPQPIPHELPILTPSSTPQAMDFVKMTADTLLAQRRPSPTPSIFLPPLVLYFHCAPVCTLVRWFCPLRHPESTTFPNASQFLFLGADPPTPPPLPELPPIHFCQFSIVPEFQFQFLRTSTQIQTPNKPKIKKRPPQKPTSKRPTGLSPPPLPVGFQLPSLVFNQPPCPSTPVIHFFRQHFPKPTHRRPRVRTFDTQSVTHFCHFWISTSTASLLCTAVAYCPLSFTAYTCSRRVLSRKF